MEGANFKNFSSFLYKEIFDENFELSVGFIKHKGWRVVPRWDECVISDFSRDWFVSSMKQMNIKTAVQFFWENSEFFPSAIGIPIEKVQSESFHKDFELLDAVLTVPGLDFLYFSSFGNDFSILASPKNLLPKRYVGNRDNIWKDFFKEVDPYQEGQFYRMGGDIILKGQVNTFRALLRIWKKYELFFP